MIKNLLNYTKLQEEIKQLKEEIRKLNQELSVLRQKDTNVILQLSEAIIKNYKF